MAPQHKATIYLNDERGHTELNGFRSFNTFNFGTYQREHKTPFGSLCVVNDDTLAGEKSIQLTVEEDMDVLLLPVVGAITYNDNGGHSTIIEAGECQVFAAPKGTSYTIANPYEEELVNFIQVWIKRPPAPTDGWPQVYSFDLNEHKDQVLVIHTDAAAAIKYSIGKYTGRHESVYTLSDTGNGLFVFVIEGAFEVQYRLLHARDGLALWEVEEVEWEALYNDAIILVLEFPL